MNWVEKSSFEKIRRLSEISEQKRHYKVLLTPYNISVVRRNPTPYTLPVIPRPLPSNIVEGEHLVIVDLRRLISSSTRPSDGPLIEASSRVQGAGSTSGSSTSPSEDSSSAHPVPSRRTRSNRPEGLHLPEKVTGFAPRVIKTKRKRVVGRRNAPGSKGEDFVPWVSVEHEDFQYLEEEDRNIALQHHEFKLQLRDVERLRLYVQSGMAEREMQSASLKEAELACRRLELEVRESAEKAARAEAERDAACHEAAMAKLEIEGAVNTRAQMESELTWVQRALAVAKSTRLKAKSECDVAQKALSLAGEACTKAEEENSRLTD